MVENCSLCLICTSKVNICCNLRIDYEKKYNSKCLQKILSYSKCLLCECSNSTFLAKTQAMPENILAQIELFMNSTSFPESYSNSVICLTCFHFLNIWHEVRSSVMKLKQNDENYGAFDNSQKTKTTKICTTDRSNEETLSVIDLVNSDAQVVENLNRSVSHSSFKTAGSISDVETSYLQNEVRFSNRLRSESPSLIISKKFGIESDSSNSEIYSLSKVVDEIVESYSTEGDILQSNSLNFGSTNAKNFNKELSITTIHDSSDNENEFITTSQFFLPESLNFSMGVSSFDSEKSSEYFSTTSSKFLVSNSNWITTEENFPSTMESSPKSEKNSQKLKSKLRKLCSCSKASSAKRNNKDQWKETTVIDYSSDSEEGVHKNTRKFKLRRPSIFQNGSSETKVLNSTKSVNDKQEVTKIVTFPSEDDENMTEGNKQIPKPKTSPILKTRENNSFNELEQTTESEFFSDTESTQKEQLTFSESETKLIDNSFDNERISKARQNNKSVEDFELETMEVDVRSDSDRITRISNSFLPNKNKISSEVKPLTNENSIDQIMQVYDSPDCDSKETLQLEIASSETDTKNVDKNQSNVLSKISEDIIMKSNTKKSSHRKISTDPQIVLSDSEDTKISKNRDNLWFYLNKLQSVKKLHKIEKLNLPKNGLDDKVYKQLPYVLLNKDEVPKTKMVTENLPKINSITIALLDDESPDIVKTSFGGQTWCCRICEKTSKTLCEHKAHELFHIKPEQVAINVVRENLKQLQDCQATENINKILAKYVDITEFQETQSNGQASGQNTPNVVNEKKRRLSILVNKKNSNDKSDQFMRTPKKVRFTLDNNNSIVPNLQSTEDLYLS